MDELTGASPILGNLHMIDGDSNSNTWVFGSVWKWAMPLNMTIFMHIYIYIDIYIYIE